jgi:hypothetical protein
MVFQAGTPSVVNGLQTDSGNYGKGLGWYRLEATTPWSEMAALLTNGI